MATIELTTYCNWNCIHCFINNHNNYGLNTERIKELLNELRNLGVYEIQFTGGEIFMRNDIMDIIAYARKLYFKVILLTNVSLLNSKLIKCLEEMHVEVISTTLFSLEDKINDKITRSKKSASKVIENCRLLSATNIRTEVKTIAMQKNYSEYRKIKRFCSEIDVDFLATEGIFPKDNGSNEPRELALTDQQLYEILKELDEIRFGKTYFFEKDINYNVCCEARYSLFIDSYGDVYPCNLWFHKIGNIKDDKIEELWNCEFLKKIKQIKWKDLPICSNCQNKDFCIRCSGIVDLVTNNHLLNDHFTCRTAKIRKEIFNEQLLQNDKVIK
nr:radical SAM protein [uncultured Faecalimonas sp.]